MKGYTQLYKSLFCAAVLGSAGYAKADGRPIPTQAAPQPQQMQPQQQQTLPLRVVSKEQFCGRLQQVFANYGAANGFNNVQMTLLASGASAELVQEFRQGRASDYLSAVAMANYAKASSRPQQEAYIPLGAFVGQAMGAGQNVTVALSAGELRFIPYAQKGMDLVVIAQNAATLTPERAHKVAEIAASMNIHIDVIWVGGSDDNAEAVTEARSLAWLAAVTGGGFANLSGNDNPCAKSL